MKPKQILIDEKTENLYNTYKKELEDEKAKPLSFSEIIRQSVGLWFDKRQRL